MKILFIHVSAGAGHMKAAEALFQGLQNNAQHEAVFVDALDYTSPSFKKLYQKTYSMLVARFPSLWGYFFELLDKERLQPLVRRVRRIYNAMNTSKLHAFLKEKNFDYIFSTHFMPTEIAAALKRGNKIQSKIVTVVTDFDVHKIWLAEGVDMYTVASDWTKEKLKSLGVRGDQIVVTGIPVNEKFSQPVDIISLKDQLGVERDLFTVLIATGSFGFGPIEEIIQALKGFQIIVVCGHNQTLYQKVRQKRYALVHVLPLVSNMHELMAVSDAMVTKPGGLSISEALVNQLPMIFFNPIPGQEMNNIKVLKKYGVGISDSTIPDIVKELEKLKSSKDAFLTAMKKTKVLARPNAVKDILSLIR